MKILNMSAALVLGAGLVGNAAAADQFLVTSGMAKQGGSAAIALDLSTDGTSRGIQARIAFPKGVKVNTSNCLSGLPDGFQGVCKQTANEVRLMAFSFEDKVLPAGILAIGSLQVEGVAKLGAGDASLQVMDFKSVDGSGAEVGTKSIIDGDLSAPSRPVRGMKQIDPAG